MKQTISYFHIFVLIIVIAIWIDKRSFFVFLAPSTLAPPGPCWTRIISYVGELRSRLKSKKITIKRTGLYRRSCTCIASHKRAPLYVWSTQRCADRLESAQHVVCNTPCICIPLHTAARTASGKHIFGFSLVGLIRTHSVRACSVGTNSYESASPLFYIKLSPVCTSP